MWSWLERTSEFLSITATSEGNYNRFSSNRYIINHQLYYYYHYYHFIAIIIIIIIIDIIIIIIIIIDGVLDSQSLSSWLIASLVIGCLTSTSEYTGTPATGRVASHQHRRHSGNVRYLASGWWFPFPSPSLWILRGWKPMLVCKYCEGQRKDCLYVISEIFFFFLYLVLIRFFSWEQYSLSFIPFSYNVFFQFAMPFLSLHLFF